MTTALLQTHTGYNQKVVDYYNECWLKRFKIGHNPHSLAIHMGYYEDGISDNEEAKINTNRVLAAMLNLSKESRLHIVDAGCGVGGTCFYLAERFPHLHLTAINISSEQIEVAREFYKRKNLQNSVYFLNEDYVQTSIPDESVHYVYAIESICHAPDKAIFYKEAFRILKPGGCLIIFDYVIADNKIISSGEKALLETFQEGWAVREFMLRPEIELESAGFESVEKKIITQQVLLGIDKSCLKATEKLSENGTAVVSARMKKHLLACISLKKLVEQGVIEYSVLKAMKK